MDILILGAKGQLGKSFNELLQKKRNYLGAINERFLNCRIYLSDIEKVNICDKEALDKYVKTIKPDVIIDCASYTYVDGAETERDLAYRVNVDGTRNVAQIAKEVNAILVYFSSDYVFSGDKKTHYTETDECKPINYYGETKVESEKIIKSLLDKYYIIRTSWLFSFFGKNFLNTIINLAKEKENIYIVDDQVGTPTSAAYLTYATLEIITKCDFGTYHCSNSGKCTWYEFACEIKKILKLEVNIHSISSEEYNSPAIRPNYSVLSKKKIIKNGIVCESWTDALNNISKMEGR